MKKINSHFHINFQGYNTDKIIRYLDTNNIEKCWIVTWEEHSPAISSIYENLSVKELIHASDLHPDRFIPFYATDPDTPNLKDLMKIL
ncbi:MAG: hypothetical protein C0597_06360 [Marinilabiliales bacterium]|nr:MAG: hypothetical protein C0597_06360 [Marinilabiliales bacterium]